MDLNEIQKQLNEVMHEQNNRPIAAFEGYSPLEMHQILNATFSLNSPVQLQTLSDSDYMLIPMLNQVRFFLELLTTQGEIKLTAKGFLPTKIVSEIYKQGFIRDEYIEMGISKLYKETDSISVNLTRILSELAGLVKKRNNKLSLTKSASKILSDNPEFFRLIFTTFATRFNWAYYDGFGDNKIGQLGYGFSLILLSKYGDEKRIDSFYADKYFKAYPQLLETISPNYGTIEGFLSRCYSIRIFERFLHYFGLILIEQEKPLMSSAIYVTKTALFDKLIKCTPHSVQNHKQ